MPHLGVNGHPQINPQMMGHVMRGNLPPPPPLQKMGNPVASPKKEEKHERVVTHGKVSFKKYYLFNFNSYFKLLILINDLIITISVKLVKMALKTKQARTFFSFA